MPFRMLPLMRQSCECPKLGILPASALAHAHQITDFESPHLADYQWATVSLSHYVLSPERETQSIEID